MRHLRPNGVQARWVAVVLLALLAACGKGGGDDKGLDPPPAPAPSVYRGTASAGGFFQVTLRKNPDRAEWKNLTKGTAGSGACVRNLDGTYTVADPSGCMTTFMEIPGYAISMPVKQTGAKNEPSLMAGVAETPLRKADLLGGRWNLLQFRTTEGGFETGFAAMDGAGNLTQSSYIPTRQAGPYKSASLPSSALVDNPGGWIDATIPEETGGTSAAKIFGSPGGFLSIDTPSGSMIGLKQALSGAFDPASAGTYMGSYYRKSATLAPGGTETGIPQTGTLLITVLPSGHVTIQDARGGTPIDDDLKPFEGSPFQGPGKVPDPCRGLFYVNDTTVEPARVVFIAFMGDALAFGCVKPLSPSLDRYDYVYGHALRGTPVVFQPFQFPFADPLVIKRLAAWGIPNWSGTEPHNGIDFQLKDTVGSALILSPTAGQVVEVTAKSNEFSDPAGQLMVSIKILVNAEWAVDLVLEPGTISDSVKAAQLAAVKVVKGQMLSVGTPLADLLRGDLPSPYVHLHYMVTRFGQNSCPYAYSSSAARLTIEQIAAYPGSTLQDGQICSAPPP